MTVFLRPELLMQRYGITSPEQIDLEALAWLLKARVRYRPLDGCEAQIMGIRDRAIITIDDRGGPERARFSLGHEIGHWQCHKNQNLQCSKDVIGSTRDTGSGKERQADSYSAGLLMPRYMFEPRVKSYNLPSFRSIGELAAEFRTSRTATALRFVDTYPLYSILICYGPKGRIWYRKSRNWPSTLVPAKEVGADSDVLGLLFERRTETRDTRRVPASTYFNGNDLQDEEVFAHAVRAGASDEPAGRSVMVLIVPVRTRLIDIAERRNGW